MFLNILSTIGGAPIIIIAQMIVYLVTFRMLRLNVSWFVHVLIAFVFSILGLVAHWIILMLLAPTDMDFAVGVILLYGASTLVVGVLLSLFLSAAKQANHIAAKERKLPIVTAISSAILGVILLSSFMVIFMIGNIPYFIIERELQAKFTKEMSQVSGISANKLDVWEGMGRGYVQVAGKGKIEFDYGKNGVSYIYKVGGYPATWSCFFIDDEGKATSASGSLTIGKSKELAKWFPFEVQGIQDLVDHYDEIIKIEQTFPLNPSYREMASPSGNGVYHVLEQPDEAFRIYSEKDGKRTACDLYVLKR